MKLDYLSRNRLTMSRRISLALAILLSPAVNAGQFEESFESLDGVAVYQGYKAISAELELVNQDAKEGDHCVLAKWTADPTHQGNGGVEKMIEPTDFSGKTLSVWVKPLTPDTVSSVWVSFHDAEGKRAEVRAWHHVSDWKNLLIVIGARGAANHFEQDKSADLTRITTVRFYALTREGGQTARVLWDGFQEAGD